MQTSATAGGRTSRPADRPGGRAGARRTPIGRVGSRRVAAAALALSALALAGCGFDEQTNAIYQPAVGSNARASEVDVLAAVIVSPKNGQGTFVATLVDNSDTKADRLTSVKAGSGVTLTNPVPSIPLPAQTAVNLADSGGIAMTGDAIDTTDSNYVTLTLDFARADAVTLRVPVVTATGPYANVGATPSAPNSVASTGATGAVGAGQ